MGLKIRYNCRTHKLKISGNALYIRLFLLIVDVFTLPKKSRYFFLTGLNCLLVLLLASVQLPDFYEQYAPVVMPATAILASTICKLGPPVNEEVPTLP